MPMPGAVGRHCGLQSLGEGRPGVASGFAVTPLLVSYVVITSIAGLVACHHSLMAWRRPDLLIHRQFAALAAVLALHSFLFLSRFQPQSPDALQALQWAQSLSEVTVLWLLVGFIARFTGYVGTAFERTARWLCLGIMVLHLITAPSGFDHAEIRGVEVILTLTGERIWRLDASWSWAYYLFAGLSLAVLVWGLRCAWQQASRGEGRRGFCLMAALGLALLAVANSVVVADLLQRPTIQFIDHSFVGLVIVMSLVMSDEVVQAGRLQRELSSREADLRSTLDAITDGVITLDERGCVARSNPAALGMLAVPGDPVGRPVTEVLRVKDRAEGTPFDLPVRKMLGGWACPGAAPLILVGGGADGRTVQIAASPIRGGNAVVTGVVLVIRDVTDRFELEEQLLQSRKMDALGQLAGGIAHDFNNMLTGILGGAELLVARHPDQSELREQAEMISSSAERAAELTQQLLAFARRGKMAMRPLSLHDTIESALALFRGASASGIRIDLDLAAAQDVIRGDEAMVQNVILNLAVNARDAMHGGGSLTISTTNRPSASGEQVEVVVADTGAGMAPEVCERIFEPFFTTKQEGYGTGLGLAAVYGTLQSMGGSIRCVSAPGRGTVFTIQLPTTRAAATASRRYRAPSRGQGRILVVDDDDVVRLTTEAMLQSLGYRVEAVASGQAALERFGDGSRYDLVVLDVVMPGMSGDVVYAQLRHRAPGLRCIVVSGYTRDASIEQMRADGVEVVLTKPFRLDDLAAGIQRAMGGQPADVDQPAEGGTAS
jgi:signal transduction histidine kinase/ActR/RegA family two-component response regulator